MLNHAKRSPSGALQYDANGRKTRQVIKEKEDDADTDAYYVTTFNYDSRDMLVEEKYLRWDDNNDEWDVMYWARYKYDTAGNMVNRMVDQIVNGNAKDYIDSSFTYSRGYQLTGFYRTADSGSETRTFTLTYDENGNMTHIEQNQAFTDSFYDITEMEFQFDEKNRMNQYRFGGAGSWYQIKYDAIGRVRERVDLTPTTTKYYSDGRQLIQQLDSSNNVEFDYFRGPTGLMRQWEENGTTKKRFYIKDNLDTVWALVDPSNLNVTRYNYNAWGKHLDKDDAGFPTDDNWMRYVGCRIEALGKSSAQLEAIYHLDNRHYLPIVAKFLQGDPYRTAEPSLPRMDIILPNSFAYSYNSPTNISDITGLQPANSPSPNGGLLGFGDYYQGQDLDSHLLETPTPFGFGDYEDPDPDDPPEHKPPGKPCCIVWKVCYRRNYKYSGKRIKWYMPDWDCICECRYEVQKIRYKFMYNEQPCTPTWQCSHYYRTRPYDCEKASSGMMWGGVWNKPCKEDYMCEGPPVIEATTDGDQWPWGIWHCTQRCNCLGYAMLNPWWPTYFGNCPWRCPWFSYSF